MKKIVTFCMVAAVLTAGGFVQADYYDPPDWDHGNPTFTHQEWDFTTSASITQPETYANPFGIPMFSIIGGAVWFPSATPYISTSTRTGLWAGMGTGSATVTLNIPNQQNQIKDKYVWIQVAILSNNINGLSMDIVLTPDAGQTVTVLSKSLYAIDGEQFGYYYEQLWKISPQPGLETITASVNFAGGVLAIDEIDVDTICIPEPTTLLILALGGLFYTRLKRA